MNQNEITAYLSKQGIKIGKVIVDHLIDKKYDGGKIGAAIAEIIIDIWDTARRDMLIKVESLVADSIADVIEL